MKLYEFNYCTECFCVERKWGDGPADCSHPDAPEPENNPNDGNVEGIDTPPDWCPLRKQPMLVKLVVNPHPGLECNCRSCRMARGGEPI